MKAKFDEQKMKKHSLSLRNIFNTESNQRVIDKSFLLKVDEYITLDNQKYASDIFFRLYMIQNLNDLNIDLEIHSWSNALQKNVPLADSMWMENEFGNGEYIDTIEKRLELIINKLLKSLSYFKKEYEIKEFIHKLENPIYSFHYKLLNLFSQDILEKILKSYFDNYPILNTNLLKNDISRNSIHYLILSHYCDGLYFDNFEISVDLGNSDYPTIEDTNKGQISKDEFLEVIGIGDD